MIIAKIREYLKASDPKHANDVLEKQLKVDVSKFWPKGIPRDVQDDLDGATNTL